MGQLNRLLYQDYKSSDAPFSFNQRVMNGDINEMSPEEIENCIDVLRLEADKLVSKLQEKARKNKPKHIKDQEERELWDIKYGPGFAQWLSDDIARVENAA